MNQNVYVIKAKHNIQLPFIQGLLASRLLSFLYRASPLGQMNRPMAQLRIVGIRSIPLPPLQERLIFEIIDAVHKIKTGVALAGWVRLNEVIYSLYGLSKDEIHQVEAWTQDIDIKFKKHCATRNRE